MTDDHFYPTFDIKLLSPEDFALASRYVGSGIRLMSPDVIIGEPAYLYRWHLVPRNREGNVYFHIQVADDPDRPLHDHPWDNQSVILSGGYIELLRDAEFEWRGQRYGGETEDVDRPPGTTIHRKAAQPHRLLLRPGAPYSMSLFTTGPNVRNWGFHTSEGFIPHEEAIQVTNGRSVYVGPKE